MAHGYRCPWCRTRTALHNEDCRYEHVAVGRIEEAHVDIVSSLSMSRHTESELKDATANGWSPLHDDVLDLYRNEGRVTTEQRETDDDSVDVLYLRTPDEYRAQLVPTESYIDTVWEHGPVDGCLDHALVAVVSWHQFQDFTWADAKQRIADWLRETGGWSRGTWEQSTPEEAVESKRHVFENEYGWKSAAQAAQSTIESAQGGVA